MVCSNEKQNEKLLPYGGFILVRATGGGQQVEKLIDIIETYQVVLTRTIKQDEGTENDGVGAILQWVAQHCFPDGRYWRRALNGVRKQATWLNVGGAPDRGNSKSW